MLKSANYTVIVIYALFMRGQNFYLNYSVKWQFDLGIIEQKTKQLSKYGNITYLAYGCLFNNRQASDVKQGDPAHSLF